MSSCGRHFVSTVIFSTTSAPAKIRPAAATRHLSLFRSLTTLASVIGDGSSLLDDYESDGDVRMPNRNWRKPSLKQRRLKEVVEADLAADGGCGENCEGSEIQAEGSGNIKVVAVPMKKKRGRPLKSFIGERSSGCH